MARSDYITFAIQNSCNARCLHCSLAALPDGFSPVTLADFETSLPERLQKGGYRGVILSGAEVTTRSDLLDFVRVARTHPQVEHVRIETNGMRLADSAYAAELVAAGVDEFFVSVIGPTAQLHDEIARVPGGFDKVMAALDNLEHAGVRLFTNTVVSALNYRALDEVAELLCRRPAIAEMHFWGLWPMHEHDENDLIARLTEVQEPLQQALRIVSTAGKRPVVKSLPACLLGDLIAAFDPSLPDVVIDAKYWRVHHRNAEGYCLYKKSCSVHRCKGLTIAYVHKFGWEEDLLQPIAAPAAQAEKDTAR